MTFWMARQENKFIPLILADSMARALLAVGALYPNISLYAHQYVLIPTSQSDKPLVVYSVRVLAKAETPCGYLTFIPLLDISASCMRLWLLWLQLQMQL